MWPFLGALVLFLVLVLLFVGERAFEGARRKRIARRALPSSARRSHDA